MNKSLIIFGIIAAIFISLIIFVINGINTASAKYEMIKTDWTLVSNQLKKRNDLIPNLVNSMVGYINHEEKIFEETTNVRSNLSNSLTTDVSLEDKIEAAQSMEETISRLLITAENHPDLKKDTNFIRLINELNEIENQISDERIRFNQTVENFNIFIKQIPGNYFAAIKGLKEQPYFKSKKGEPETPPAEEDSL
ncbi:LemA family protein [Candidatus Desantisbacteria bacterium]|nr:LemA family protein [Candidatus Desantisbacteria bacterium]